MLSDGSGTSLYGLGRIGEDGSGGWGYHLGDALGSVRQIANDSGQLSLSQSFEPFGAPMASSGEGSSGFGFTGEQDAAGLVFLRARFYDPTVGRFLTKDPFPGYASQPSTLNPYTYGLNNPATLVDPSGRNPLLIAAAIGTIIGMVGGAVSYMISNPGADLGDMLSSACFWKSVVIGGITGAVSGLFTGFLGGLGILGTNFIQTVVLGAFTGFISGGVGEGVNQLLTFGKITNWNAVLGSAITGAITGAIFSAIGHWIGSTLFRPASRPDFYVQPDGDVISSTGYRYISSDAEYLSELVKSGVVPANPEGTYFTFNQFASASEASSALQVPHNASIQLKFDTLQIIDDISIPKGMWGTATYLEPLTQDFPKFGSGGATQAITTSSINLMEIVNLISGEVLGVFQ